MDSEINILNLEIEQQEWLNKMRDAQFDCVMEESENPVVEPIEVDNEEKANDEKTNVNVKENEIGFAVRKNVLQEYNILVERMFLFFYIIGKPKW